MADVLSRAALSIVVPGTPVGQAALSHGKHGHSYYSNGKKLKPWRKAVAAAAEQKLAELAELGIVGLGPFPLDKALAVVLDATFYIPRPKTVKRAHPTVYPDLQHYVRAAEDSLSGLVFVDDGQIVDTSARKRYAEGSPCAVLSIRILETA